MASALTNSRPSFNSVRTMACPTLPGRGHQEDPDIPGDVADDQGGQAAFARVKCTPEEAGGGGRPGQRQVLRYQMNTAVERRGHQHPAQPAEFALQSVLDQAAPEELFARSDHERQRRGDGRSGRGRSQRVNPGNLARPGRHDPTSHRIPQTKDSVERRGRAEAYRKVTPARPFEPQRRLTQERVRTEAANAERHPAPDLGTGTAKRGCPDRRRQGESAEDSPQRSPDPATRPTSSNAPKALCSRAVIRSIIAMARR